MQEGRTYTLRRRVKVILNKSFPIFRELDVGDKGLMSLVGIVEGKRIETQPDGTELIIQSINITQAEKVEILGSQRI